MAVAGAEPEIEPEPEPEPEPEIEAAVELAPDGEVEVEVAADGDGESDVVVLPTNAVELDDATLERLVEAIVFAADKPVTLQRLRQLTRIADPRRIEQALDALAQIYADRGIALQQVSGGYQFRTNTAYSSWVQQLIAGRPVRLSRAQLETLAIVAYRQPITRPEIDEIRGVDSSATLRLLLDRSLVRVLGKREEVGRPMLYGTTGEFLDFFSLQDLRELPTLREYSELTAESRQVMSDRLGVSLDAEPEPSSEPEPEIMLASADDTTHVAGPHEIVDTTAHVEALDGEPEPEPEPQPDDAELG
jgi:segregation and condensation protein B